jgi:hypothetical protein
MKTLITILSLMIAASAFAAPPSKVGFRSYSTAVSTQCAVFGMKQTLTRDDNGVAIQHFAPNPNLSRTYTLGNKGYANYSTNGVKMIRFTCRITPLTAATASTAVRVKVFMDAVETHFLTLSDGDLVVSQ